MKFPEWANLEKSYFNYSDSYCTEAPNVRVKYVAHKASCFMFTFRDKYDAPCLTKITLDNWRCFGQVEVLSTAGGTLDNWRCYR